jgi:Uma2 family endonuclease
MIRNATLSSPAALIYPENDSKPMPDNSKQFCWIMVLLSNLTALFRKRLDVFVDGNLFWYPVEGQAEVRAAPDVFVVFGRQKGVRRSYRQWEEGNVPPAVVFEILPPNALAVEYDQHLEFYDSNGVAEYYTYNPAINHLRVFLTDGQLLQQKRPAHGFVSPRLGIRFDFSAPEMVVYGPDGTRFLTFEELRIARMEEVENRIRRLAELSRKVRRGQATPEELQELDRLEEQSAPPSP